MSVQELTFCRWMHTQGDHFSWLCALVNLWKLLQVWNAGKPSTSSSSGPCLVYCQIISSALIPNDSQSTHAGLVHPQSSDRSDLSISSSSFVVAWDEPFSTSSAGVTVYPQPSCPLLSKMLMASWGEVAVVSSVWLCGGSGSADCLSTGKCGWRLVHLFEPCEICFFSDTFFSD